MSQFRIVADAAFFKNIDGIIRSKIVQIGKELYQCVDCGKVNKNRTNLSKHVEDRHVQYGGLSCSVCGKHCTSRNSLATHYSRHHRPQVK